MEDAPQLLSRGILAFGDNFYDYTRDSKMFGKSNDIWISSFTLFLRHQKYYSPFPTASWCPSWFYIANQPRWFKQATQLSGSNEKIVPKAFSASENNNTKKSGHWFLNNDQ